MIDDKAFEEMLAGESAVAKTGNQPGNVLPSSDLHDFKHQDSMGIQSLFNMMEPKGGDTGTTPRNDYGSFFVGRSNNNAMNSSFDLRPQLSPNLQGIAMKPRILNPTPLRHGSSMISNTNSILPSFGGGGGQNRPSDMGR